LLDLEKHLKKKAEWRKGVHNPVNTEWELLQVVFDSVVLRWDRPHVDLFATSLNHKLETFVSPVPDPLSFAVDAMSLSWDGMFAYAFILC
jgi:hypothetical protein